MDRNNVITWNTGRMYSQHGQRMAARAFHGGVLFVDVDRNIDGHIPAPIPLTERSVMARYDVNDYRCYVPGVDYGEYYAARVALEEIARRQS